MVSIPICIPTNDKRDEEKQKLKRKRIGRIEETIECLCAPLLISIPEEDIPRDTKTNKAGKGDSKKDVLIDVKKLHSRIQILPWPSFEGIVVYCSKKSKRDAQMQEMGFVINS